MRTDSIGYQIYLNRLAAERAALIFNKFNPGQARDKQGRWTAGHPALTREPLLPPGGIKDVKWHDRDTFFKNTAAVFKEVPTPKRDPDYSSSSGSVYWYTKEGVYRKSDHWGRDIATTNWFLGKQKQSESSFDWKGGEKTGFAKWEDFRSQGNFKTKEEKLALEIKSSGDANVKLKKYPQYGTFIMGKGMHDNWYQRTKYEDDRPLRGV